MKHNIVIAKKENESIDWIAESKNIQELLTKGCTLTFIGKKYGVSRQRIFQVVEEIGFNRRRRSARANEMPNPIS